MVRSTCRPANESQSGRNDSNRWIFLERAPVTSTQAVTGTRHARRSVSHARYSSGTELWILSAGHGLISADKLIKPYSATFATRASDSVWRGGDDGDRRKRRQEWWSALPHDASLMDLLAGGSQTTVVIAAGADYVAAIRDDLDSAIDFDESDERVSVISAGTQESRTCLPVNGRFRTAVKGTDSSLNARILALLARAAGTHRFGRSAMATMLRRVEAQLTPRTPPDHIRLTDEQLVDRIQAIQQVTPGVSRTTALRALWDGGAACEQGRFARLWRAA